MMGCSSRWSSSGLPTTRGLSVWPECPRSPLGLLLLLLLLLDPGRPPCMLLCSVAGTTGQQHWQHGWETSSMCSMTTDATWASDSMARSSSLASSLDGSMVTDDGSCCCACDLGLHDDMDRAVFE